jgi:hypothetical protein
MKNTGIPHFESRYKVEQHIKNLGIPYTIIGPTFFMENLLGPGLGFTFIPIYHFTTKRSSITVYIINKFAVPW